MDTILTLDQLCTLTDMPKRTVRYYMQIGLIDRPIGETRGAHYVQRHVDQLLRVKQLTDAGVSLERIRTVMAGEEAPVQLRQRRPGAIQVRSHVFVAQGIELQIDPEEAGLSPEQLRAFVKAVMTQFQDLKNEE